LLQRKQNINNTDQCHPVSQIIPTQFSYCSRNEERIELSWMLRSLNAWLWHPGVVEAYC